MPRKKDLKRVIRTRMNKTGEAYTTARARILSKSKTKSDSLPTASAAGPAKEYASVAGMSDDTIAQKTGQNWSRWVQVLDSEGAAEMSHTQIAALVNEKYEVDGWWSQAVTVGYERIKGLRARGQRRDGTYEANKSRTFNVPVATLFDAWANAKTRGRWLKGETVKVRTATKPKSLRLGMSDGSIVAVGFMPKSAKKSAVAVQHTKLPDAETAARFKQFWSERLEALGDVLT